jgi:hypothetical protein
MSDSPSQPLGLPPGVHLRAELIWKTEVGEVVRRQLRILGDEARGFLVAGFAGIPENDGDEFWYRTLAEAIEAEERLGVTPAAWIEIGSVGEVWIVDPTPAGG